MTCRVVFQPRWLRTASEVRWPRGLGRWLGPWPMTGSRWWSRSGDTPRSWLLSWLTVPVQVGGGRWGGGASDWESLPGFKAKAATGLLCDFEQSLLSPASVSEPQRGDLGEGVEGEVRLAGTPLGVLNGCSPSSSSRSCPPCLPPLGVEAGQPGGWSLGLWRQGGLD